MKIIHKEELREIDIHACIKEHRYIYILRRTNMDAEMHPQDRPREMPWQECSAAPEKDSHVVVEQVNFRSFCLVARLISKGKSVNECETLQILFEKCGRERQTEGEREKRRFISRWSFYCYSW